MDDVVVICLSFNRLVEVHGTPGVFRYHSRSGAADAIRVRVFRQNQIPNVLAEATPFLLRGFVPHTQNFIRLRGRRCTPTCAIAHCCRRAGQVHSLDDRARAFDPTRVRERDVPGATAPPRKDCRDFCRDTPSKRVVIPSKNASAGLLGEAGNCLIPSNFDQSVASLQSVGSELATGGLCGKAASDGLRSPGLVPNKSGVRARLRCNKCEYKRAAQIGYPEWRELSSDVGSFHTQGQRSGGR